MSYRRASDLLKVALVTLVLAGAGCVRFTQHRHAVGNEWLERGGPAAALANPEFQLADRLATTCWYAGLASLAATIVFGALAFVASERDRQRATSRGFDVLR